jgi:hypothetical protein
MGRHLPEGSRTSSSPEIGQDRLKFSTVASRLGGSVERAQLSMRIRIGLVLKQRQLANQRSLESPDGIVGGMR